MLLKLIKLWDGVLLCYSCCMVRAKLQRIKCVVQRIRTIGVPRANGSFAPSTMSGYLATRSKIALAITGWDASAAMALEYLPKQ